MRKAVCIFLITLILSSLAAPLCKVSADELPEIKLAAELSDSPTSNYCGENAVILKTDQGVCWNFTSVELKKQNITINYCPLKEGGNDIEIEVFLDGKPLLEARSNFRLKRLWREIRDFEEERFETDNQGNEIVPHMEEVFEYQSVTLTANEGTDKQLETDLAAGNHQLKINVLGQGVAISSVVISTEGEAPSYSQRLKEWEKADAEIPNGVENIKIEAELAGIRSDKSNYPSYDRSTPSTSPNSATKIMLNVIGGSRWSDAGQWLSWDFEVPESGYYEINFKYRQDAVRGLSVYRRVEIDGELPFKELESVTFSYGLSWQQNKLSDEMGEPYKIYLEKGKHSIKLTAVLGIMQETVQNLEDAVKRLNSQYRYIVMVTGTSPDTYRDYYLDKELPNLISELKSIKNLLSEENDRLNSITDGDGGQAAFISEMIRQLEGFIEDSATIPSRLQKFKSNIGSLAELVTELKEEPLTLDTITVSPNGSGFKQKNASIFKVLAFRIKAFVSTFIKDYSTLGNSYENGEEPLEIWVSVNDLLTSGVASGRDQAQTLKRMVDERFTVQSKIPVNLSLVNTSDVLTQAIMGGKGPDIALFVPESVPANLALRGALADLSKFEGFKELSSEIHPASFIAYTYEDGIYAMPETQVYPMMFVRTDVLSELNVAVPNTWDELYNAIAKLQKKNMQVGIPESQSVFEMLLLQNGGSLYNDDLTETNLHTPEAQTAFKSWTELYLQYSLDVSLNFFNRFRTGEMPLGITDFTMYNQLSVAAPEINGCWKMYPIPGIERDGKIVRTETCNGSAAIMLSSSKKQDSGWEFIKWWISNEVQTDFAFEMESVLGAAARYNSANTKSFDSLAWSKDEKSALLTQREYVSDIPLTPANYYITRNLTNAFRKVVYQYKNSNEVLDKYASDINDELKRKTIELEGVGKSNTK